MPAVDMDCPSRPTLVKSTCSLQRLPASQTILPIHALTGQSRSARRCCHGEGSCRAWDGPCPCPRCPWGGPCQPCRLRCCLQAANARSCSQATARDGPASGCLLRDQRQARAPMPARTLTLCHAPGLALLSSANCVTEKVTPCKTWYLAGGQEGCVSQQTHRWWGGRRQCTHPSSHRWLHPSKHKHT